MQYKLKKILIAGQADLIAMGRELMYNPFWPLHAAQELNVDPKNIKCGQINTDGL